MEILNQITGWFDIIWFWSGRAIGGVFSFALAVGIFLTILEYAWGVGERVCGSIKRVIQETKLFVQFLKWKRDN